MYSFPRDEFAYNKVTISRSRILKNAELLKNAHPGIAIAPVLKSNAYGHGIDLVGSLLDTLEFPFYCVNSLFEATMLREAGVKTDILIMGYVAPEDLQKKQYDFIFAVFAIEQAKTLSQLQERPRVHINVETGLHREGVDVLHFESMVDELRQLSNLQVEGMMSHLACSNDPACPTNEQQLTAFKQAKELLKEKGFAPKWFHLGGTLALLNNFAGECNVVRCGKAFFGIALNASYSGGQQAGADDASVAEYQPVLQVTTRVAQVKKIKEGDHVSYADAFVADKDMTIGILPIGYYDGIDRRLSNKGIMKVKGVTCRMLGMVAMNVSIIDLTDVPEPKIGGEVLVYSMERTDENSLDNAAKTCGTLPQDLLLHLALTMPRNLVE